MCITRPCYLLIRMAKMATFFCDYHTDRVFQYTLKLAKQIFCYIRFHLQKNSLEKQVVPDQR